MHAAFQAFFPTSIAAVSFLVFNCFDSPCLAAISTMAKEIGSRKYFWYSILFQNIAAYCVTLIIYQLVGVALGEVVFGPATVVAGILLIGVLYLLFRKDPNRETKNVRVPGQA